VFYIGFRCANPTVQPWSGNPLSHAIVGSLR
jgi:hypothetical protein